MSETQGTPAGANGQQAVDAVQVPNSTTEVQNDTQGQDGKNATPKQKDLLSPKFAALTKKQREIVKSEQEFKAKEEAFNKKMDSFLANKNNPIAALEALGYSYEDATNYVLNGQVPEGVTKKHEKTEIEKRIEKMESAIKDKEEKEKQQIDEAKKKQFEQDLGTFKQGVKSYLADNAEQFEFLAKEQDPGQLLYDYIVAVNEQSGGKAEINVEALGKELEDYLAEEAFAEYEKLQNTNKVKNKFNINNNEAFPLPPSNKVEPKVSQGSKTLTNQQASGSSSNPNKKLTDEERFEQSVRMLKGLK